MKIIPNINECIKLLQEKEVPQNILIHSYKVCQVAAFITVELNKKGMEIDLYEVKAGALLHDICKMQGILEKKDHAKLAAQFLMERGFFSIAEIVRQHVKLDMFRYTLEPAVIVNYADKRVKHHEIVSLPERFEDLFIRYGKTKESIERIKEIQKEAEILEDFIFKHLDIHVNYINTLNEIPFEY